MAAAAVEELAEELLPAPEPADTVQNTASQPAAVQETVLDTVTVPDSVLELGGFLDPEIPERREL